MNTIKTQIESFKDLGFQLDLNKVYENRKEYSPQSYIDKNEHSYYVLNKRNHQIEVYVCFNTETLETYTQFQLWFNPRVPHSNLIPMLTSSDYNKFLHKVKKSIYSKL